MGNFAKDLIGLNAAPTLARELPVFGVNIAIVAVLIVLATTTADRPTVFYVIAGVALVLSLIRLAVAARRGSDAASVPRR